MCLQVSAVPFFWQTFLQSTAPRQDSFYANFAQQQKPQEPLTGIQLSADASTPSLHGRADAARLRAQVVEAVRAVHGQEIATDAPLIQAGLDSLGEQDTCLNACAAV